MAVSSPLNPSSIASERSTSASAAQNFISGGQTLGEGVVSAAANKIVGFQRGGAAGVAAPPPNLSNIIQTLSSNILNNVQGQVQSINQNVTNIVNQTTGRLEEDYKQRISKTDSATPNSILQNFLNSYREAIGYIQFLGNKNNIKTLGANLKLLIKNFSESFEVAKIIRQTINRIVKQLSSLPKATGGPGGINMDINVPGGRLKKGAPRGLMRMMRRRPGMMLGGAALLGAGGGAVVNAMSSPDTSAMQTISSGDPLSGPVLDRFNAILDAFSKAIDAFAGGSKSSSSSSSSSSSGSRTSPDLSGDLDDVSGAGQTPGSSNIEPGSEEEARIAAALVTEGAGGTAATDILQVAANRMATGKYKDYTDVFAAERQFQGVFDNPRGGTEGYRKIKTVADAAAWAGVSEEVIKSRIADMRNPELRADSAKFIKGAQQFRAAPRYYLEKGLVPGEMGSDGRFYDSSWRGGSGDNQFFTTPGDMGAGTEAAPINYDGSKLVAAAKPTEPEKPTVTPAQTSQEVQQQIAKTVSQSPATQQSKVTVLPMDMSSPQVQSQPKDGGSQISPPVMNKGGVSVPFLNSSNGDNYLSLYSKIVYNIVDG